MASSIILWTASALFSLVSFEIYRIFFHPLAQIPGPFSAKLSGHWRNTRIRAGTWHEEILEVHDKYGKVVRIAPDEVSIVDAKAVKLLYSHGSNASKTEWYHTWDPDAGAPSLFNVRDRKLHTFLRKKVSRAYSMTSILSYEARIQDCLTLLLQKLQELSSKNQSIDMSVWTSALAYDVIGALAYGTPLGQLETGTDTFDVRRNILDFFHFASILGNYPGQIRLLSNPVMKAIGSLFGRKDGIADFVAWSAVMIKQRMEDEEKCQGRDQHEDMLNHFLGMKDMEGNPASFEEILMEGANLVGAGADTTAIAMRACLRELSRNPQVQKNLRKEIDEFYTTAELSGPIKYLETQQLPYLVAVCKESMRLFPSIVGQLMRHMPEAGLEIDGKYIPASTEVGISPVVQNRDKAIFGKDADTFRPERWLEGPEQSNAMDAVILTFGGNGPRNCIGRNIAMVQVQKFVAQIVRHFELRLVNNDRPWRVTSYWFAFQHDMMMQLTPRSEYPVPT